MTVETGSRLQDMKLKVSAAMRIAVFRMPTYTWRRLSAQACCLVLSLSLLALPLAGAKSEREPILIPLATDVVPLGTVLQPAPGDLFHAPLLVAPGKHVLGLMPPRAFVLIPNSDGRPQNLARQDFFDSSSIDSPHGRAPPSN